MYTIKDIDIRHFYFFGPDNDSFGYNMGWWKEEHFNASDGDGDGLLNLTEFNK